jgi:hypothetical protein
VTESSAREVRIAGVAVAVAVTVIGALIGVIPEIDSVVKAVAVVVPAVLVLVASAVVILKEVRRLVVRRDFGEKLTAYQFDQETGILVKGKIPNVSLRVKTIHTTLDHLVAAVPDYLREPVLRKAGYDVGANWAAEFRTTLWQSGLRKGEFTRQLLRWSEYDATAGMGRLVVALEPDLKRGTVMLHNSFLSKTAASFPLNYWFAGYIAGTMDVLFGVLHEVKLLDPTTEPASLVGFRVKALGG